MLWVLRCALVLSVLLAGGCPTVDLGESPAAPGSCRPDPTYFHDILWPEVIATPSDPAKTCLGAVGCHRQDSGRSALRFIADEPLSDADFRDNYNVVTRFLSCGAPAQSSFLTKPLSGIDPHGGGDLLEPGSDAETVFLQWFAQ